MMKFRIAIALGEPHPDLLLRRMSYPQWVELLAFCEIEPIGDERADIRAGLAAMDMVNVQIASGPKVKLERYLPFRQKHQKTDDEIWRTFESMFPDDGSAESISEQTNGSSSADQHRLQRHNREPGEECKTR